MPAAQWREIVEAIGFDPSRISRQQMAQAMDAVDLVWEDQKLRLMLKDFAWDYVKSQHAIELTELGGGAVLDIVITAILAALTAGAGIAAAAASKTRHLPKLRKLGDLLLEFVEQSKALARYAKDKAARGAKGGRRDFTDLKTDQSVSTNTSKPTNTANAIKNPDIPMSQEKFDEIINLENGNRPADPSVYLPKSYIDAHLKRFQDEGAGFIVIEDWIANPNHTAFPKDGKFVGLASEMDNVVDKFKASGGDWTILRDELALGKNVDLSQTRISYVKLSPSDGRFPYSMPTGNERGAYPGEWTPGGLTKTGTREATLHGGDVLVHNNNVDNLTGIPDIHVELLK